MSGEPILASPDAFGQFRVKEMREDDFWLGASTPTSLKSPKCHILLFYEPTSTDRDLLTIWSMLAQTVAGPVIGAVNTSARGEIMDAFMSVSADPDNPLNDFSGFGIPTILVYRNRWPQAFYNGELSYDAIKKWILVLACKPGYKERSLLFNGVAAVLPDKYVKEPRIENFPYPTSSVDFTATTGQGPSGNPSYGEEEGGEEEEGEEEGQGGEEEGGDEGGEEEGSYTENTTDVGYLNE